MLKTPPTRRAIALGFALLVIAWLASLPSPSCEPPKPSGEADQTSNNLKKDCPTIFGAFITYIGHFIHDNRDEITAGSTAIIAVFTAILGVFTVRLAKSTHVAANAARDSAEAANKQAKAATVANIAAKDTLQKSQRPWVIVESIDLIKPITYSNNRYEILFNLTLKNTGNSVATDVFTVMRIEENLVVKLETNWKKTDDDLGDKKEFIIKPSKWPLGIVLAPGQLIPQPFGFGGPMATPGYPSVAKVQTGTFYLLGLIEYKDQFGIAHKTRFAFNPWGDSINPWDGKTFVVSGGMQEAD